jgi:hypothetical protein
MRFKSFLETGRTPRENAAAAEAAAAELRH